MPPSLPPAAAARPHRLARGGIGLVVAFSLASPRVLQAEVAEALQTELLGPAVGGVGRAPDVVDEDPLDPAVDPLTL